MCRLLAYIGERMSARPLVFDGGHSLYEQSWAPGELLSGSVNADGYGIAWYDANRPVRIARSEPIWYDGDLPRTLGALASGCVVAALRNGTPGIPLDASGLPPLIFGEWAFVLNGFVPDFRTRHMRELRSSLPDDLYGRLAGSSDSETLFLLCVAALREGASAQDALMSTAGLVYGRVDTEEAQLTMVIADGRSITALRSSNVAATNSLYVAEKPEVAPGGVVVASEPVDGSVWEAVPGHSWIRVEAGGQVGSDTFLASG